MSALEERLSSSPAVRAARQALGEEAGAWLVGGALREALIGRPVVDVDLAVAGDPEDLARAIARVGDAHAFELSERFGAWRVVSRDRGWGADVVRLRAEGIEADLRARDFTVNAMALPLAGGELLDPLGGAADLEARILRAASDRSFGDDPLRVLRAARIAADLELEIEGGTLGLARDAAHRAAEPAGERQFAELRGIVSGPSPARGLELMDALGATAVVLPEVEALRGVEQNPYHHLDVHGHTLAVLEQTVALERDLPLATGEHADEVATLLGEPLADELTGAGALRFAALFHDLGKPRTRTVHEGRVMFMGHDAVGAEIVSGVCRRLRTSRRLSAYLQSLTLNHLRLGFLVHERPVPRRRVYEYLVATEPFAIDVTLLSVADRLATQGRKTRREAIDAHLELARQMIGEALGWRRSGRPSPPIAGEELAQELGIEAGPELGRLLTEIEAATYSGEVRTREDAIALARELHSAGAQG